MKKTVYAYLHTHWDLEWYRNQQEFNLRFLEVMDIVIDELKNNKAPFFYLDGQVIALLNYLKYRKDKIEEIKKLINDEKLIIGPFYASIDTYLVNINSMLKNVDLGYKYSKFFGQKGDFIGYLSDVFGISNSIFEVLKLKKIKNALIWRGVNPKKINNHCDFIKNDIKTTWLAQGYFNDFLHNDNLEGLKKYLDKISKYSSDTCLLPIGADHLGMLKDANEKIKRANEFLDDYEIVLINPIKYFKKVEYLNTTKEKEFLDNSDTYILSGVYSARVAQKIRNNQVQNDLTRIIEPLNFYLGEKYSENIEEIYENLIKNHAHDGIYGCSIDSVHKSIDARLEKNEQAICAIKKRLIGNFKEKHSICGKTKDKIGLFNLSNSKINVLKVQLPYILNNSQIIDIKKGFCDELLYDVYKIPVTEDITNLYTQLVEIKSNKIFEFNTLKIEKPNKNNKITNNSIENPFVKLFIKNNRIYLLNKKTNESYELKLTDIKDVGDSYNFAPCGEYKEIDLIKTKIECDGNIQSILKLCFKDIELSAIIDNYCEFIKFKIKINNKKKNHKLQLNLILKENIKETVAQDAIGIINRKIDFNYKMQDYMPAKRPIELKSNAYPMQNFVCANNAIVLTKGLHEYEIYKNELRICLLRAFSTISNPKNPARSIPAGPDLKTPLGQSLGIVNCEIILSFGNYKKAFKILDNLFENYVVIDGDFEKEINFKFDEIPSDSYIYGINNNKKILYNYKNNKIDMI